MLILLARFPARRQLETPVSGTLWDERCRGMGSRGERQRKILCHPVFPQRAAIWGVEDPAPFWQLQADSGDSVKMQSKWRD